MSIWQFIERIESFQLWKSLNLLFEMFEKQSFAFCIKNLPLESQVGPFLKELDDFPINHHFPYFSSRSWRLSLCSFFHKAFEIFNLDGVGKPLPASKWRSCDLTFPQWCAKVWNGYLCRGGAKSEAHEAWTSPTYWRCFTTLLFAYVLCSWELSTNIIITYSLSST